MKDYKKNYKKGDLVYFIDDIDNEIIHTGVVVEKNIKNHSGYSFRAKSTSFNILSNGNLIQKPAAALYESVEALKMDLLIKLRGTDYAPDVVYKK